jgi:hypothetical protein
MFLARRQQLIGVICRYGPFVPVLGVPLKNFKKGKSDGILSVRCPVYAGRRQVAQLLKNRLTADSAGSFRFRVTLT